ncbi:uncharacterized protein LOC112349156 [Selaginella moellendorffii]|uniref:uncharacterized protein LOC112349156 n=1 Tax=Selaginella moellendorffii TaxID=88036 RepID=UPI000D1C5851|nr:uncharacterized protein LOC112349156 [Selaginella moellendorffii]|eukprot:XP_024538761.1 uncharacterized protein LOC112349156 [Selaginella moellendorffii]
MASLAMAFSSSFDGAGRVSRILRSRSAVERSISAARPCGMSSSSIRGLHSHNVARISRIAARREEEEEPQEEEDYELLTLEKLREQRNLMNDIMKRKVRVYKKKFKRREAREQGTVEEQFVSTFDRLEPFFEDEKPSEGMKQLLALVESSRAFDEPPPPKYQVPQWLQNAGVITLYALFLYVVVYVNEVLDDYDERKALEKEAAMADKGEDLEKAKKSMEKSLESEFNVAAGRVGTTAENQRNVQKEPNVLERFSQTIQLWLRSLWFSILGKWKGRS